MNAPTPDPDPQAVLAAAGWEGRAFKRITDGWDNAIWRFETPDGRAHCLRLYRRDSESARRAADMEALAMEGARSAGLPVPKIEARGMFESRPVFVIEWAKGKNLADLVKAQPWNVIRVGREMGRLQARLHATPPPAGLITWTSAGIEGAIEHRGLREAILREARFDTFCHLDFHPLNILGEGHLPTTILDWPNAAICDPRVDLAYTRATLLLVPPPPGEPRRLIQVARGLLARGWHHGYAKAAGSFPLDPLFDALGAVRYAGEAERAVAEGRGWLTQTDLSALARVRDRKLREAGLTAR